MGVEWPANTNPATASVANAIAATSARRAVSERGAARASQVQIDGRDDEDADRFAEARHPDCRRPVRPDRGTLDPDQGEPLTSDAGGGSRERAEHEEREHVAQARERPVEAGDPHEEPPAEEALAGDERRRSERRAAVEPDGEPDRERPDDEPRRDARPPCDERRERDPGRRPHRRNRGWRRRAAKGKSAIAAMPMSQ